MKFDKKPESLIELVSELNKNNAGPYEKECAIDAFLDEKAREKSIPLKGQFEITPVCNLDCKMCYVHLNKEQLSGKSIISFDSLKKIFDEAVNCGMSYAVLSGGECLTHPEFDKIYLYLLSKGVKTSVMTNGLLLNKERIEFFKEYRPQKIQITLYGYSEESFYCVTGRKEFKTVYNNILLAKNAGLPVFISLTPNGYMGENGEETVKLVHSLNIPYEINTSIFTPRKDTGRQKDTVSDDEYIKWFKTKALLDGKEIIKKNPSSIPKVSVSGEPLKGLRCGGGMSGFTVDWQGVMHPCNRLYNISAYPLSEGFKAAFHKINAEVKNFLLPAECSECAYKKVCQPCVAVHSDNGGKPGHCSKAICEFTLKLAEEGLINAD